MRKVIFGGKDVTNLVNDLESVIVSTETFGDPQWGIYKFLYIQDEVKTMIGFEGDIAYLNKPSICSRIAPLDDYVENGKGLELDGPFPIDLNIKRKCHSFDLKIQEEKVYDFIIMKNTHNIDNMLKYGGYCICVTDLDSKFDVESYFLENNLKLVYKQLSAKRIYVGKKFHSEIKNSKTLIIYTFHQINDWIKYFLRYGLFESPTYSFLIVINDPNLTINVPSYVKVINRDNIGFDFGAWSVGINSSDKYDYYILINGSVTGPFVNKKNILWPETFLNKLTDEIQLVGTTINCANLDKMIIPTSPHIQSMVLAMPRKIVDLLIQKNILNPQIMETSFRNLITQREIGSSQQVIKAGYNIATICPVIPDVDFRDIKSTDAVWYDLLAPNILQQLYVPSDLIFVKVNRTPGLHWALNWERRQDFFSPIEDIFYGEVDMREFLLQKTLKDNWLIPRRRNPLTGLQSNDIWRINRIKIPNRYETLVFYQKENILYFTELTIYS